MTPLTLPLKKKFIVLIGFMGAGKTSLGRRLSEKINLPHIDTDYEIEKIKKMKINNIFEFYGESYFRELEQSTIIDIISKSEAAIISLGGGSFLNLKIREVIKKKCLSIWINVDIDTAYERINNSKNIRPIFSKMKSKSDLEVLLNKRNLIYKEANIKIEATKLNKSRLLEKVLFKITKYLENGNENY